MAKYVKVKKVYKMLHSIGGCDAKPESWADGWDKAIDAAINELEKMPAADVQEVKHGQWIKEKRSVLVHWHCSVCKDCYYLDEPNAEYCPHCGAKMDGEGNNSDTV